ncbi:MAG: TIM barrel protein [Bacteroidota bacterium]
MTTSRRDFLRAGSLAVGGAILLPAWACNPAAKSQSGGPGLVTGLQLYSVRDEMRQDPLDTLTKLRQMGYTVVEHANYVNGKFYGWTPQEFKKVLDDLGMTMPSGHTVLGKNHWDEQTGDFTAEWKKLVEDAAYMGQEYVVSPWLDGALRQTYDDLVRFMEIFNKCGELCKQSGMRFGYHNHDFEFSEKLNDMTLWDIMMNNTDADKVVMQLDTGNMYVAGALAKDLLEKYPGRYDNIHIKDMVRTADGNSFESTIVGSGLLPMKEIADLARDSGTKLFIIEQESYQGKTPMECMEANFAAMKAWGYL